LRYLRERERLLGARPKADGFKNSRELSKSGSGKDEMGNEEEEEEEEKQNRLKDQKVYVLDRGFVGWQERFGEDERLTEGYRKELWKDGYWM
jgi:hypothetical protein